MKRIECFKVVSDATYDPVYETADGTPSPGTKFVYRSLTHSRASVRYELLKTAKPMVGALLAFQDLESALSFMIVDRSSDHSGDSALVRGLGFRYDENPLPLAVPTKSIIDKWDLWAATKETRRQEDLEDAVYELMTRGGWQWPNGTIFLSDFTPIEVLVEPITVLSSLDENVVAAWRDPDRRVTSAGRRLGLRECGSALVGGTHRIRIDRSDTCNTGEKSNEVD